MGKLAQWGICVVGALVACKDPTQVRVDVSTRGIACAELESTRLTHQEDGTARHVDTVQCTSQGDGASIGDIVYAPSGDANATFRLQVSLGLNGKSAESCQAACGADCVVATRRLSFVEHQQLYMPIVAENSCIGECCDPGFTCIAGGCVSDDIEPCSEGDPNCDDDSGGGGKPVPSEVVGVYHRLLNNTSDVTLVANRPHPDAPDRSAGFVLPQPFEVPSSAPVMCSSDDGNVGFVAGTRFNDELLLVGRGRGRVECGRANGQALARDLPDGEAAFIVRIGSDNDAGMELLPFISDSGGGSFTVGDVAVFGLTRFVVALHREGEVRIRSANASETVAGSAVTVLAFDQTGPVFGLIGRRDFFTQGNVGRVTMVGASNPEGLLSFQTDGPVDLGGGFSGPMSDHVVIVRGDGLGNPTGGELRLERVEPLGGGATLLGLGAAGSSTEQTDRVAMSLDGSVAWLGQVAGVDGQQSCGWLDISPYVSQMGTLVGPDGCRGLVVGRSTVSKSLDELTGILHEGRWTFTLPSASGGVASLELEADAVKPSVLTTTSTSELWLAGQADDEASLSPQGGAMLCPGASYFDAVTGQFLACYMAL